MIFKRFIALILSLFSSLALAANVIITGNNNVVINGKSVGDSQYDDTPITTEVRPLAPFDSFAVIGTMEVVWVKSDTSKVEITASQRVLKEVTSEIKNGTLLLKQNGNVFSNRGIKVRVFSNTLQAINLEGTGSITAKGVEAKDFDIQVSGTGEINVSGTVTNLSIKKSGTGEVSAKKLISQNLRLRANGTGDVVVYASKSADVKIEGTGDATVYGSPSSVKTKSTGVGNINIE